MAARSAIRTERVANVLVGFTRRRNLAYRAMLEVGALEDQCQNLRVQRLRHILNHGHLANVQVLSKQKLIVKPQQR